jgi:hypothetical protein
VNVRPAVSLAELSGPTRPVAVSMPSTLKELVWIEVRAVPALRLPGDGSVPDTVRSARLSAPPAADTPGSLAIRFTDASRSVPRPLADEVSRFLLNHVPAGGLLAKVPLICCLISNLAAPPDPAAAALVTVTSVPTP